MTARDAAVKAAAEALAEHCPDGPSCAYHAAVAEAAVTAAAPHLLDAAEQRRIAAVCACGHPRTSHTPLDLGDCDDCPHGTCTATPSVGLLWDHRHLRGLLDAERAECRAEVENLRAEVERLQSKRECDGTSALAGQAHHSMHGLPGHPCHELYARCFRNEDDLREYRVRQREHGARVAAEAERRRIAAALALHRPVPHGWSDTALVCDYCGSDYPCLTVRALTDAGDDAPTTTTED